VIIFRGLTKGQIKEIVDIQVRALAKRLGDRKLKLELTDDAKDFLTEMGWDPIYGARPLKRAIQKSILDPLAMEVLQGRFREGDTVVVDRDGDGLAFKTGARELELETVTA
jgi:ATP-dependent Clp protease ATP-binding subunit ClpB